MNINLEEFIGIIQNAMSLRNRLRDANQIYKSSLHKFFPTLFCISFTEQRRSLDEEVDFYLSSLLTIKSGRIQIPYNNQEKWGPKFLVLTKNPGLKSPHSSSSYINFSSINKMLENGDWILERLERNSKGPSKTIGLSVLKEHPNIDQKRYQEFLNIMTKEVSFPLDSEDFHGWKKCSLKNNPKINIFFEDYGVSVEIEIDSKNHWTSKESMEEICGHFTKEKSWGYGHLGASDEYLDVLIGKNFSEIISVLIEAEKDKKILVEKIKILTKRFKVLNQPFKLIKKLET
jgi:hypothetical protein